VQLPLKNTHPFTTGLVNKQIQKAIKDDIASGLEYFDGQLVSIQARMVGVKVNRGESQTHGLQWT
jgi:hypothetical protein